MPIRELVTFHGHMKDGEIGPFTGNVIFRLTDNADVPVASERLARLALLKEQYDAKYLECFAGDHAAVLRKKNAKALLVLELDELAIELCMAAKGDRVKLASTGFMLVRKPIRGRELPKPTNFKVSCGVNDGSLIFSVKSNPSATAYVFLYTPSESASTDFATWSQVCSSSSKLEVTGFKHAVDYLCRCAYLGTKGRITYSDAITILAR